MTCSNPVGYAGTFRYSDHFPDAVLPWWSDAATDLVDAGGDSDDVLSAISTDLYDEVTRELDSSESAAEFEAHTSSSCPDVVVRAFVLQLFNPPWAPTDKGPQRAWILFWEDGGEFTIVEHADREHAVKAFFAHVALREKEGDRYDYVVDPRQRRTAMPPGFTPPN